ncbi:MAG: pseudouridine-5'-phosphate glycosidase, partial [Ilumatobacteraceae bacterium]
MTTPHPSLVLTGEVADALRDGHPVVTLESTIISHGMPYPQNVQMAVEVEQIIRDGGVVPATIAVLGGQAHIGLSAAELELLAT